MKSSRFLLPVISLAALLLGGCASSPVKPDKSTGRIAPIQEPVLPRLQAYPVNPAVTMDEPILVAEEPQPVWKPTRIQKVQLDAYVDEKGNLHRPGEMYVRVEEGGWNLDAVRRPGGYIPPENSVKPYDLPGVNYGPSYTVPRKGTQSPTALFDMRDVRLTGLTSQADRELAESMAGEGEVALHDPRVGWIIIPQAAMQGTVSMPSQLSNIPTHAVEQGRVVTPVPTPMPRPNTQMRAPTRPAVEPAPATPAPTPAPAQPAETDLFDDL